MIDSQLLSYLIVFSETGSLLKSSEILHLSQPSLSKAMQKLEAELDLTIFDRTGRMVLKIRILCPENTVAAQQYKNTQSLFSFLQVFVY